MGLKQARAIAYGIITGQYTCIHVVVVLRACEIIHDILAWIKQTEFLVSCKCFFSYTFSVLQCSVLDQRSRCGATLRQAALV